MNREELSEIESIYMKIRRCMPYKIWVHPKGQFETSIRDIMVEFTVYLQTKHKEVTETLKMQTQEEFDKEFDEYLKNPKKYKERR